MTGEQIRTPAWVVAHQVNTGKKVKQALAAGANAIEFDVSTVDGQLWARHDAGEALFGQSTPLGPYLEQLRAIAQKTAHLSMVLCDCKVDDEHLFTQLRQAMSAALADLGVSVVYSVGKLGMGSFFFSTPHGRETNIMFDQEDDVQAVVKFLHRYSDHIGYGTGNSVIGNDFLEYMEAALRLRCTTKQPRFIDTWTINDFDFTYEYFNIGVDAVLVDIPYIKVSVRQLKKLSAHRFLAARGDRPFLPRGRMINLILDHVLRKDQTFNFNLAGTDEFQHEGRLTRINSGVSFQKGSIQSSAPLYHDFIQIETNRHKTTLQAVTLIAESDPDVGSLVDRITVEDSNGSLLYADFGVRVFGGERISGALGKEHYELTVVTSDIMLAGTDGRITIRLTGDKASVQRTFNSGWEDADANNRQWERFEAGSTDLLDIRGTHIGSLTGIEVENDGSGSASDWHIEKIVAEHGSARHEFAFNRWIKSGEVASVKIP